MATGRAVLSMWAEHPFATDASAQQLIRNSNDALYIAKVYRRLEKDNWVIQNEEQDGDSILWTATINCDSPLEALQLCSPHNPRRWGSLEYIDDEAEEHSTIW